MEIDITDLIGRDHWHVAASVATHGQDGPKLAWEAAKQAAETLAPLKAPEQLQAMRDWSRGTGAWDDEEIASWDDNTLNALFLQEVELTRRERGEDEFLNDCKGVDGRYYFDLE